MRRITSGEKKVGIYFVFPCFLFILIFLAYPLFRNVYLSFYDYNPLKSLDVNFIGLENYRWLIKEPVFLNSLYITGLFTVVSVVLEFCVGLLIAVLLARLRDRSLIGRWVSGFLLSIFIIPWAVPGISAAVSWRMLYHPLFGPINAVLGMNIMWLSDPKISLFAIIFADVWKTAPFFIIVFFAAIMSVPKGQFEAARIDGATEWQEFRHIMLPAILPVAIVACIFRAIDAFTKIFDLVYMLTGGGPGRATEVLPLLIYKTAFSFLRFGRASALSVVAIIISLFFGIWLLRESR